MPGLSTPSKEPTELVGWKRWDSPRRNLIPNPVRGDNHNRCQTPLQRPYLGRQRSTHKYTQIRNNELADLKWKIPAYSSLKLWSRGTTLALTRLFIAMFAIAASSQQSPSSPCTIRKGNLYFTESLSSRGLFTFNPDHNY